MGKVEPYLIKIDFFKKGSGKWYSGGEVEVSHYIYDDGFLQDIVNNQTILRDGWQDEDFFNVVTRNVDDDGDEPYAHHLFDSSRFVGLVRNE